MWHPKRTISSVAVFGLKWYVTDDFIAALLAVEAKMLQPGIEHGDVAAELALPLHVVGAVQLALAELVGVGLEVAVFAAAHLVFEHLVELALADAGGRPQVESLATCGAFQEYESL